MIKPTSSDETANLRYLDIDQRIWAHRLGSCSAVWRHTLDSLANTCFLVTRRWCLWPEPLLVIPPSETARHRFFKEEDPGA
jgi:hypothetical protein